jgi:hypothetical protein
MALFDFISNRDGQRTASEQQSQQQRPETYKEQKTREAAEEKVTAKPISQLPPDRQAQVDAVKSDLQKATQNQEQSAVVSAPTPQDGATSPQPMMQKSMNQDKVAPASSPTSAQAGTPSTEQEAPSAANQGKTQDKSQDRPQTIARPAPSWER